jgi:hypothetical protein
MSPGSSGFTLCRSPARFVEHHQGSKVMTQDARLENFLFAEIGTADSGAALTMISALARSGSDPWMEAARLSTLPRAGAVEALRLFLGKMPSEWCSLSDCATTATRLLNLLPSAEVRIPVMLPRRLDFRAYLERHLFGIAAVLLVAVALGYLIR